MSTPAKMTSEQMNIFIDECQKQIGMMIMAVKPLMSDIVERELDRLHTFNRDEILDAVVAEGLRQYGHTIENEAMRLATRLAVARREKRK